MTTYAVTGASGHFGADAVEELLARGIPPEHVVALARTTSKAEALARRGVQVREADYDRPETLEKAMQGVDRLLLVSSDTVGTRVAQHRAVIDAARAAGVRRIAYTSLLRADTSDNPLAPDHLATEEYLSASGIPHTLLRNGWYLENYTRGYDHYVHACAVIGSTGGAPISAAARADYAAAAVTSLIEDEGDHVVYELGGEPFTLRDVAEAVERISGEEISSHDLSAEELADYLQERDGLSEGAARFAAAVDTSIRNGGLEVAPGQLRALAGRELTTLGDAMAAEAERAKQA